MSTEDLTRREKLRGLYLVATYRPILTVFLVLFSGLVAVLEGIGVSFIIPIIEMAQGSGEAAADDELVGIFLTAFETAGVPFTLGYVVLAVSAVITVRYISSFLVSWMRVWLRTNYVRDLQSRAFESALDARIAYFDKEGSDDVLNAIVTQAEYAGKVIRDFVRFFEQILLIGMYLAIAFYISPLMTVVAGVAIAVLTFVIRHVLEGGYDVGDQVADANEGIQQNVQTGTQGIRDVKLTGMSDDLYDKFSTHIDRFTDSSVKLGRNEAAIGSAYNLSIAILVFGLIYVSISFADMSLGALAAFLFIMFQLGPRVSSANEYFYKVEGRLPHLVRTQQFIEELEANQDFQGGDRPIPEPPTPIAFEDVSFSYQEGDQVLEDISFRVEDGEFVAFVGQSGEGKSTIAALLARLYEPDDGEITADGIPIDEFDTEEWRSRIAFVRQDPYIFNKTLFENVTAGNGDATRDEVEEACEIAQVTEFLDELPDGYDTKLGDNGVRLSGGQRQRVALARALLEDADVLVLDEATSDLDATIERRVQDGIESMSQEYTIVAIAHRLSTVRDADRIYTLEDGTIAERGEHGQLLELDGAYADLYTAQ
ncbi:ABC transporter ATP-binding protein [Natronolimnohabitans sp. A-GB9]|uniref:ABC transporter ATP-binding protein n=1 Tax=Natronolimnohabitans sp. A-GB9 TaxID=3069757 RepID=UPI0027B4CA0C|nr:ABC transporter ATP-binding protein [Natronolimnohabitans sp. A-GB9]MDQ2050799.1 ABC transporter ATP-binding protein [Natronolimnohabitans sp. A-GB9]